MKTNTFHAKKVLMALFAVLLPLVASAQTKVEIDGIWYNLVSKAKQAEVTSSGGTKYSGSITIPATVTYDGVAYSVTSIGDYAFYYCSGLTAITLPEGVTSIGEWAFIGCTSLTAITLPEGVTSIGEKAFDGCSSLTDINIPEGVTSIGEEAFNGCSSLTAINIPEGVTSIGSSAFSRCSNLTTITIPENSQLTSIGSTAFYGCSNLTAINIPEGVTSIGYSTFSDCSSLTAITIPENSQLTSIGDYAFFWCSSLTAITIPEGVTSIREEAFAHCSSLTAITIPENSQLTSIGDYAFYGCSSLTAITIPESVTSIGKEAFGGCSSLTAITLPKSVSRIGSNAFANCPELTDVYCYAEKVPTTDTNAFEGSYIEYATLHVPTNAVASYKTTAPWSSFGKFETTSIAVESITLSQSTATLTEGESLTLTATVAPNDADDLSITWSSNNPSIATIDNMGKVTAIAPGTAIITVTANDGSGVIAQCEVTVTPASYVITFLIDGEQVLVQTLTRGSAITLPDVPTKEGYTFSGWGEVPETMPARDVTIEGTFTANKYLVTFKIGDEVIASDSLEYQSAIVAPEAPEKEGYTFSGWGEVADAVPAHDLTYEGSYSINFYTLTYLVDGDVVLTLSVAYGATIPSLKAPEKEGYTFSGWSEAPATMPAKDVTIEGTFTQLPSVYLTINQADNGCVKQHLVQGTSCTFVIEAAEGWKIHTVTFNGEDVTSQLTEEGTFTTPELQDDAVLNIAYEKIDDAISHAQASRIKVQGHQGIISISGITEGTDISLYTTDGTLVTRETAEDDTAHLTVPTGQVYIVKVADTVVKIGM